MTLADEKSALRRRMRALRLVADQKHGPDAAREATAHFLAGLDRVGVRRGTVVAGYWPIITEIDVRPLLAKLDAMGCPCALPAIVDRGAPLAFRRWHPLDDVEAGPLGTFQPPDSAPTVRPDVVIAPMLAVDGRGFRLGQGGGYYDRTLAALDAGGRVVAVGVGYAVQRIAAVPHDGDDRPMDWVLTDAGLEKVGG